MLKISHMASTSDSQHENNSSLIDQFISVTGSNKEKALKMLEICGWNLEMAVNMHVDFDYQENDCKAEKNPENLLSENESDVRPPIPQSRGILVEEDLSFHYGLRGRKRRPHSVFDGFRDFQAEAQLPSNGESSESFKKRRTLEDLFRPPLDIMHRGSFESARESGQVTNRWLMVNIQDSREFSCQVLNRDVWSNREVKNIVSKHFVFWQVYSDSVDGQRYMQFYKPVDFPYIAIIDPRTGEKVVVWQKVDASAICEMVATFLKENSSPNGTSTSVNSPSKYSLLDQSEEYQIKAALEASLKDSAHVIVEDNDSEFETFDSDSESTGEKLTSLNSDHSNDTIDVVGDVESNDKEDLKSESTWKDYLGSDDDPKTDLVLRFPDGKKEQITWPCTTKMKSLVLFISELGYDPDKYELVTNYPRRNLCQVDLLKTLKEADLFPREMVFVQLKA